MDSSEMNTSTISTGNIPADVLADADALIEAAMAGRKPDPIVVHRSRERAARVTEEIRRKHGVLDIGVSAIRELRDQ